MSDLMELEWASPTGVMRFDFQIAACVHAKGRVLNVGANEDPAGLRERFGSKVINTDLMAFDAGMNRPNVVDDVFDMTEFPWPYDDGYADLVLMGDVLEHMPYEVIVDCLREAARVGREVAFTVPEDHRMDEAERRRLWQKGAYNEHTTCCTEDVLRKALDEAGLRPYIFLGADWGFGDGTQGWCVVAHQA